jgi:hypothetical protein
VRRCQAESLGDSQPGLKHHAHQERVAVALAGSLQR